MMAHNLCYTTLLRPGAAQKLGYAAFIQDVPQTTLSPVSHLIDTSGPEVMVQGKDLGVKDLRDRPWMWANGEADLGEART